MPAAGGNRVGFIWIEWSDRSSVVLKGILANRVCGLNSFILPGGSESSTYLHIARTITRRAERKVVALSKKEKINSVTIIYLNRLSDLLFVLARYTNSKGKKDILWKPGKNLKK